MRPCMSTVAGILLLCMVMSAADSEPWNEIDSLVAPIIGPHKQRYRCPQQNRVIQKMRPLLRRLLLSMVWLQRCRNDASSDLCTAPPPNFQRHHHCQLLSLSQNAAQACTAELQQCKLPTECTGCSSASQSNIAALQWLLPRHSYCSDLQFKKVGTTCRER